MEEQKTLTCIGCPLGCTITVEMEDDKVKNVSGNTCKRGEQYAKTEVTNPVRTVTSTVKVEGGVNAVTSVKTAGDIPKAAVFDCIEAIRNVTLKAPTTIGEIVLKNVCNTGVDVVVTKNVGAI